MDSGDMKFFDVLQNLSKQWYNKYIKLWNLKILGIFSQGQQKQFSSPQGYVVLQNLQTKETKSCSQPTLFFKTACPSFAEIV